VDRRRHVAVALEVAEHRLDAGFDQVVSLLGLADQSPDPVAALGQQPAQLQADLSVSACNRHVHGALQSSGP
jgi:hypothetical protein